MGQGASNAIDSFNTLVGNLSGASNPDLSFFETFPNGVAGADTTQPVTTAIPTTTSDVLEPFKADREQYVTLANEVATLNNRVGLLDGLLNNTAFNPSLLDLVSHLERLEDVYTADRNTLLTDLDDCLAATRLNVTRVCGPVINNEATNAFEYYASDGTNPDFFAQQNMLALQYTGVTLPNEDGAVPTEGRSLRSTGAQAARSSRAGSIGKRSRKSTMSGMVDDHRKYWILVAMGAMLGVILRTRERHAALVAPPDHALAASRRPRVDLVALGGSEFSW